MRVKCSRFKYEYWTTAWGEGLGVVWDWELISERTPTIVDPFVWMEGDWVFPNGIHRLSRPFAHSEVHKGTSP